MISRRGGIETLLHSRRQTLEAWGTLLACRAGTRGDARPPVHENIKHSLLGFTFPLSAIRQTILDLAELRFNARVKLSLRCLEDRSAGRNG